MPKDGNAGSAEKRSVGEAANAECTTRFTSSPKTACVSHFAMRTRGKPVLKVHAKSHEGSQLERVTGIEPA